MYYITLFVCMYVYVCVHVSTYIYLSISPYLFNLYYECVPEMLFWAAWLHLEGGSELL